MNTVSVLEGNRPLILAQPHGGTWITPDIFQRLNRTGQAMADTDWHINRLYDGLVDDITVVQSHVHRYVIDANRPPDDRSLYPGQNTTGLCPTTDFEGNPIYQSGMAPDSDEIRQRLSRYHNPYHDALAAQIIRLKKTHESIIVYDCHSIRSQIPFLFDGILPDLNIGTNCGSSCSSRIEQCVSRICDNAGEFTAIVNGRFKGGWTTRQYGDPLSGIHAIQMELTQSTYMQESPPWSYDESKSRRIRETLGEILESLLKLTL